MTPWHLARTLRENLWQTLSHYSCWCGAINIVMSHLQCERTWRKKGDWGMKINECDWMGVIDFASVSHRAEEKEGLTSENKGVCPSPSPFYWSKLRCKPSFQQSLLPRHQGAFSLFCERELEWHPCPLGDKKMLLDAAALTCTNAHCDLHKAYCATQTFGRWCPWVVV